MARDIVGIAQRVFEVAERLVPAEHGEVLTPSLLPKFSLRREITTRPPMIVTRSPNEA